MIEISKKCFIFYLHNPINNTFLSELHVAIFFIIFEIILFLILVIFSKKSIIISLVFILPFLITILYLKYLKNRERLRMDFIFSKKRK